MKKTLDKTYKPIIITEPESIVSEQYRKLRTNIEFSNFNFEINTISVLSSQEKEGKTLTAVNLAVAYEQSKIKTLLIDMDLRKPRVHRAFGIINDRGLSDIIINKEDFKKILYSRSEFLDVITTGSKLPFPAEFLMSKALKDFLDSIKAEYDRVIIDTPPLALVTDGMIIGAMCDGVILVVKSNGTDINLVKRITQELNENKINIIGAVLTQVKNTFGRYKYYNYSNYYSENKHDLKVDSDSNLVQE